MAPMRSMGAGCGRLGYHCLPVPLVSLGIRERPVRPTAEAERYVAQAGAPPYGGRGDARTSPHGWGFGGGESPLLARPKEKKDSGQHGQQMKRM